MTTDGPVVISGSLQSPDSADEETNTHAEQRIGYYVIVGCGTAAVVNHATLRQSAWGQDRIGDLPVMHIGFEDPWKHYHPHGMGQPPYLLNMPGFHKRPGVRQIRSGYHSRDFSSATTDAWKRLQKAHPFEHRKAWVAAVESGSNRQAVTAVKDKLIEEGLSSIQANKLDTPFDPKRDDPKYRIAIISDEGELDFVYAEKIDFCVGAGRPRVTGSFDDKLTEGARGRPWVPPESWGEEEKLRLVVTGPEALRKETPWKATDRFYVNGAGGIGLNMVERAEDVDCNVDWATRGWLHATFNLKRNDTVLWNNQKLRPMEPGEAPFRGDDLTIRNEADFPLTPASRRWRFGSNLDLESSSVTKRHRLRLALKGTGEFRDHQGKDTEVTLGRRPFTKGYLILNDLRDLHESDPKRDERDYDRFFICKGLVSNQLGNPNTSAAGFALEPIRSWDDVSSGRAQKYSTAVGLQTSDESIRVLGAAAMMYPGNPMKAFGAEDSHTKTWFESLPFSAVPPGFIFMGMCIADANRWYAGGRGSNNVNASSNTWMTEYLWFRDEDTVRGKIPDLVNAIVAKRRLRNGYENIDQVVADLVGHSCTKHFPTWEKYVRMLRTDYPDPPEYADPAN